MAPLTVVTWKWQPHNGYSPLRVRYTPDHVHAMQRMVARHYPSAHRFVCITDDPAGLNCETFPLWPDCATLDNACGEKLPSCYRRLKLFSSALAPVLGERIVSLDLDMVLTGDCRPLWDRPDPFVGWAVKGTHHARVYNGSIFLVRPGALAFVWDEFDPARSPAVSKNAGYLGSDQGWLSFRLGPDRPGWTDADGVYSYSRSIKKHHGGALPANARIVAFHGKHKPWSDEAALVAPWIKTHWLGAAPPARPDVPRRRTAFAEVRRGLV